MVILRALWAFLSAIVRRRRTTTLIIESREVRPLLISTVSRARCAGEIDPSRVYREGER